MKKDLPGGHDGAKSRVSRVNLSYREAVKYLFFLQRYADPIEVRRLPSKKQMDTMKWHQMMEMPVCSMVQNYCLQPFLLRRSSSGAEFILNLAYSGMWRTDIDMSRLEASYFGTK